MSWHPSSSGHLAWHKLQLGWLSERSFAVVRRGPWTGLVTPGDDNEGIKGVVVLVGGPEAYVAEVRSLDGRPESPTGVLCYKVSLLRGTGEGPIRVIPARADDNNPDLVKRFGTLYNALRHGRPRPDGVRGPHQDRDPRPRRPGLPHAGDALKGPSTAVVARSPDGCCGEVSRPRHADDRRSTALRGDRSAL